MKTGGDNCDSDYAYIYSTTMTVYFFIQQTEQNRSTETITFELDITCKAQFTVSTLPILL